MGKKILDNEWSNQNQETATVEKESVDHDAFMEPLWSDEDKAAFDIDRDKEDSDVVCFQKNGDISLFDKIYEIRIPSLKVWARKYYYLSDGSDDMYGEFSLSFSKAVLHYDKSRGSFNTCLYTFLKNCVSNLRNGKLAKKRRPKDSDPLKIKNYTLSIDHNYSTKEGEESTLKDILSDDMGSHVDVSHGMQLHESISFLSKDDPTIKSFLKTLCDGSTLSSLLKNLKTKKGRLKISKAQAKQLNQKRRCNRIVSNIIQDKTELDRFYLIDYKITPFNKLHYTVELDKTHESDLMMKTVRRLRRDKDFVIKKLQG